MDYDTIRIWLTGLLSAGPSLEVVDEGTSFNIVYQFHYEHTDELARICHSNPYTGHSQMQSTLTRSQKTVSDYENAERPTLATLSAELSSELMMIFSLSLS